MTGIYLIKNKLNGNSYIGQSVDIEERWRGHILDSKNELRHNYDYPLYRAIRKHGVHNFEFIVLQECDKEQLTDMEIYWYNLIKPIYNQKTPNISKNQQGSGNSFYGKSHTQATKDKIGSKNSIAVIMLDKNTLEPLMEFKSLKSAADYLGIFKSSRITKCIRNHPKVKTAYGFKWKYK